MLARILSLVVPLYAFSIATASLAIAWGEEHDVRVVDPVDRCRVVAAKADAQGTIHLLYDRDDGPQYVKSIDRGQSLSPAIPILNAAPQPAGLVFEGKDIAIGQRGRVHVVMWTNAYKLKLPQEEWGLHYASLDPEASAFSPVRNINHKPSEGFSLAADGKGNLTACCLSGKLYANVSHDDGETFSSYAEINPTYDPCNCCTTSCVYCADGRLAVLYREETNNDRDMYVILWDQASGRSSRTQISTTLWKVDACPMTYFSLARSSNGFVAAWPTKGEIYFARLDARGKPLPPGEIKTPGTIGMRTGILTLSGANGSTLVAWKKDGRLGWQLYDTNGKPNGPAGSAKSAGDGIAGVVDRDGEFILFR